MPHHNLRRLNALSVRLVASGLRSPYTTSEGRIYFQWRDPLEIEDEESEGYLPEWVESVLEISSVHASSQGSGKGRKLMSSFLSLPEVINADAVYLDLSPHLKSLDGAPMEGEESSVMDRLQSFYRSFGFRNSRNHARMWLFSRNVLESELPR